MLEQGFSCLNRPCQHTPHSLRRLPLGCAGDVGVGIQKVKGLLQNAVFRPERKICALKKLLRAAFLAVLNNFFSGLIFQNSILQQALCFTSNMPKSCLTGFQTPRIDTSFRHRKHSKPSSWTCLAHDSTPVRLG